jgi:glycosyltransferase involved in cell wall biosynthesis
VTRPSAAGPTRVLVVHNAYRSDVPSGENQTVSELVDAMGGAGVDVRTYFRSSDEIAAMGRWDRLALAARPVHSPGDVRALRTELDRFRPDIVQVHNPYPLISPSVVKASRQAGAAVVNYVHNYRHVCMPGTFYRDGHDCTQCTGTAGPLAGVLHGCYRGSRAQSSVMAVALSVHRRTWLGVERFVAISRHIAGYLKAFGVPPARISVIANAVSDPGRPSPLGRGFLFAGRLDETKGVGLLLDAWRRAALPHPARLRIAGDGPLRGDVQRAASATRGIEYLGALSKGEVAGVIREAAVMVVPSTWQEPFGRSAIEALAHGRPVLATAVGGLAEVVRPDVGWLVGPEAAALAGGLITASAAPDLREKGLAARAEFEARYIRERQVNLLLGVYDEVLAALADGAAPGRRRH